MGALLRRAQILNEHKIVIGSTEFDYDQMTVRIGSENSTGASQRNFCFCTNWQHRQDVHFTKQQLMDDINTQVKQNVIRLKFILEELERDLRKILILKLSLCEGLDIRW